MSDLFESTVLDKPRTGQNLPEFTVSELAGGIKRTLEETFARVRVRGEISQPKYHTSGHLYLSLKDENAVISAVCWKGQLGKLAVRPEEGMDVVATGRITTYPARSNYQMVIEELSLAGEGALLKLLQERKKKLQAEGLFDAARKKPLPKLPQKIGVITSETGAVIRDILHRLADRYPVSVLLWPVAVQGEGAALQVANALAGMNSLPAAMQPDVLIVARGGGSLEDLMAFNEEVVVRAAAASRIPLISAVGHETDTTLIDFAADVRAPTPTAAAELATPHTRHDLQQNVAALAMRAARVLQATLATARLRLEKDAQALAQPARYVESRMQAFDERAERLPRAMKQWLQQLALQVQRRQLPAPQHYVQQASLRLAQPAARLGVVRYTLERASARLENLGRLLQGYSYAGILSKGFALVRGADGQVITSAKALPPASAATLVFADGERKVKAE